MPSVAQNKKRFLKWERYYLREVRANLGEGWELFPYNTNRRGCAPRRVIVVHSIQQKPAVVKRGWMYTLYRRGHMKNYTKLFYQKRWAPIGIRSVWLWPR